MINVLEEVKHLRDIGYSESVVEERMRESFDLFDIDTVFYTEDEYQEQAYDYHRYEVTEISRKLEIYLRESLSCRLTLREREDICVFLEEC